MLAECRRSAHERQDGKLTLAHRSDRIRHPLHGVSALAHGAQLSLSGGDCLASPTQRSTCTLGRATGHRCLPDTACLSVVPLPAHTRATRLVSQHRRGPFARGIESRLTKHVTEGEEAFSAAIATEPQPEAHPGALVTLDDLEAKCRALGEAILGAKVELAKRIRQRTPRPSSSTRPSPRSG